MEIWRSITGYEGLYEVSDAGRVRSLNRITDNGKRIRGKLIKPHTNRATGYSCVGLCKGGRRRTITVHRLVALAFVPSVDGANTVNHIDEDKQNNNAYNLEWLTLTDNLNYGTHNARANENRKYYSGARHHNYGLRGANAHTHKGRVVAVGVNDPSKRFEFDTAATASRALGLSSGQICDAINGKAKSCGGYYWSRCDG